MLDVVTETVIHCPRAAVAEYAGDPGNAPEWYANIDSVEWMTPPPMKVGSRLAFRARFLWKDLNYTYEVTAFEPNTRLVMSTAQGPFPMETTYEWEELSANSTRMRLRNRGAPSGFSRIFAPFMATAVRSANQKDLAALKAIVEKRCARSG